MPTHVLTGASSGIGAAIAEQLSARGDALVLFVRNAERATEMRAKFPAATCIVADLSQPDTLESVLSTAALPEHCDSLIHSAGMVDLGTVADLTVSSWQQQLTLNVVAPAELTRLLLPRIRAARGHVVCINSGAGLRTSPQWSAYAASKHALKAFADGLRAEESAHQVRVTSVYPGRTATPMQQHVHEQEHANYVAEHWIAPESVARSVVAALDLPRDAHLVDLTIRPGHPAG